ncbi:MAG: EamA family transporter [Marinilabiliales bacterium]|nr:MAG: EamA family transporter [Marinilabiliales bacterium]
MGFMKQQKKAYILALVAIFFWSTMSSAFKISLRYIQFDLLLFWSAIFGIVALTIILLSNKEINLNKQFNKKSIVRSAVMGFFNPFLYYIVLLKAYSLLEAQVAGILNYTWPIVLVILSVPFLKQKIPLYSFVALFISFIGIIVIGTDGSPLNFEFNEPWGVFLALLSSLFWAIYWILNLKDKDRKSEEKIFLNLLIGFIYVAIYLISTGVKITIPSWQALLGSAYIGMFELSISFVIWLNALKYSSNTAKVSNLVYLSPFVALFWIRLTVGEEIHLYTVIGLVFIIGGIFLQQFLSGKRKNMEAG